MLKDVRIGRAFFRIYNTRGAGFRVRLHKFGFTLWAGCIMLEGAWLHGKNCDCWSCYYEREFYLEDNDEEEV